MTGLEMNERIKELAEQAGFTKTFARSGLWLADDEELERFAELIVGECIDIARQHNNSGEGGVIAESIEVYFKIKGEVK